MLVQVLLCKDCLLINDFLSYQEAERLEPSEDQTSYNYIDYTEKRSLPISIPDYHYVDKDGEKFVVVIWI